MWAIVAGSPERGERVVLDEREEGGQVLAGPDGHRDAPPLGCPMPGRHAQPPARRSVSRALSTSTHKVEPAGPGGRASTAAIHASRRSPWRPVSMSPNAAT